MTISVQRALMEQRRLRAAQLHRKGWRNCDIAQAFNVSSAAVSQWISTLVRDGDEGLKARPRPGAPRRLSARHTLMLQVLLRQKPSAHDIKAAKWDRILFQKVIKRLFGVTYSLQHCGRLLKAAKTSTAPIRRVVQIELGDLLKKADIARIRTRLDSRHGRRIS